MGLDLFGRKKKLLILQLREINSKQADLLNGCEIHSANLQKQVENMKLLIKSDTESFQLISARFRNSLRANDILTAKIKALESELETFKDKYLTSRRKKKNVRSRN